MKVENRRNRTSEKNVIWIVLLTLIVPVVAGYLLGTFTQSEYVHIPLHATIEAIGGMVAIIIALILYLKHRRSDPTLSHFNWVGYALLTMGILDIFHAASIPGDQFVWLHSLAVLFGGLILMQVWQTEKSITLSLYQWLPWGFVCFALLLSFGAVVFPQSVPPMLDQDNQFTPLANLLNIAGGLGFLIASLKFIKSYLRSKQVTDLLFAGHTLLFSTSGLLFLTSGIWDPQWWFWHIIRLLAYLVAFYFIYIEYQKGLERIATLSITDSLTALFNRRHFNQIMPAEIRRAHREDHTLWLAMMDIDHFKDYNDRYGHLKGDAVLSKVGQVLNRHTSRASDYAFRLGGEEFAVVFTEENAEKARHYVKQILKDMEAMQIPHAGNTASPYITVSIGLSALDQVASFKLNEFYKTVDQLLYQAKHQGRNRLVINT